MARAGEGDDAQNVRSDSEKLAIFGLLMSSHRRPLRTKTFGEDDVEGQLVGAGILRADDIGNIGKRVISFPAASASGNSVAGSATRIR